MKPHAFDVVKGMYPSLDGTPSLGLFVVIYTEEKDSDIHYNKNIVGLKLTSKPLFLDKYSYALPQYRNKFLDKDSWVQCNKPHVLDIDECTVIGQIDLGTRMALYRRFKEFLIESDNQMLDFIPVKGGK